MKLSVVSTRRLLSWGSCRGKYRCSSGVTECGSPVARVDSRTQEKTRQCILIQVVGALCPAVVVLCIREHPNWGVTTKEKEIRQGIAQCYHKAHRRRGFFPGQKKERSSLLPGCRGEERSVVPLGLLCSERSSECSGLFGEFDLFSL